MATAKTLAEQMKSVEDEILNKQNFLKELRNRHRVQESKERTHHLIERGAILESLIEDATIFTNEQIKDFLIKTIQTDFARKILTQFKEQNTANINPKQTIQKSKSGEVTGEKSESEQVTLDGG